MNQTKQSAKPSEILLEQAPPEDSSLRRRIGNALYEALMDGMEPEDIVAALDAERQYFLEQVNSPNFE